MLKRFSIAMLSVAVATAKTLECESSGDDTCMAIDRKSANGQLISLRPGDYAVLSLDNTSSQQQQT